MKLAIAARATALVILGLAGADSAAHDPAVRAGSVAERRQVRFPVRDFELTDQDGRLLRFASLKGQVVLVGFAYTTCPDVCPLLTAAMRNLQRTLATSQKNSIYFLTVTTDPEVDTPVVLKAYAKRYDADFSNWAFLTGSAAALGPVWENFGVRVVRKARGLIDHTPLSALVDRKGVTRFVYLGPLPAEPVLIKDLAELLRRGG